MLKSFIKNHLMKVLFIDDDKDDQEFYRLAAQQISPTVICESAQDGKEAIEKLNNSADLPQLVILDINMPRMNGWETLKVIRETPRFQSIDVVICSTSSEETDIKRSATLGARFITKANSLNQIAINLSEVILGTLALTRQKAFSINPAR
jgi:CheY-like chemotaxis protein